MAPDQPPMPSKKIDFEVVREIALALPHVEQSTLHGVPSLKLRGKLLCCPALHGSAEPDTLVLRIDRAERAKLVAANPKVYYVTDHYLNYPTVLVRLAQIDQRSLRDLLGLAWQLASQPRTTRNGAKRRPAK